MTDVAGTGLALVGLSGCLDAENDADGGDANATSTPNETDTAGTESNPQPEVTPDEPAETEETAGETERTEETAGEPEETPVFPDRETIEVRVVTPDGERLASLTAAIAETSREWTVGLSDTESLPEDWGMLFVSDSVSDRTFWMREMDFGLDIVFVDDEKVITGIHHAPEPGPGEDGTDQRYAGRGQYVLEVNYRWTDRHHVTEGDVLEFDR